MGLQGGGRRTPDESGAKLTEAGLPLGFSLKQGYRPYMEEQQQDLSRRTTIRWTCLFS